MMRTIVQGNYTITSPEGYTPQVGDVFYHTEGHYLENSHVRLVEIDDDDTQYPYLWEHVAKAGHSYWCLGGNVTLLSNEAAPVEAAPVEAAPVEYVYVVISNGACVVRSVHTDAESALKETGPTSRSVKKLRLTRPKS